MNKPTEVSLQATAAAACKLEEAETSGTAQAIEGKEADQSKQSAIRPAPYWQLFTYADRRDRLLILIGFIAAAGNGAILPLFTIIFGKVINTFGKGTASPGYSDSTASQNAFRSEINHVCLDFVYLAIAAGVASYFEVAFWMLAGNRQARRIKEKYLRAVLRQDVTFFDDNKTSSGDLTASINEDTIAVQNALGEKVGNAIHNLSTAIVGFIIAFIRGWSMTLVILAAVPLLALCGALIASMAGRLEAALASSYAAANQLAEESLGNMRTVSAFNGQQKATQAYSEKLMVSQQTQTRGGLMTGSMIGMVQGFMMFTYALALWFGSTRILAGQYDGGKVVNVLFAAIIGGFALGMAAPALQQIIAGKAAFARLKKVLDRVPSIDVDAGGETLAAVKGHVELRQVSFVYPARPEVTVLKSFTMNVLAGSSFALCGQSGSGKSTVIQLIERFYDPTAGEVLFDSVNIRSLDLQWYRDHVGLVSQEPTLFATDIFSNIAYGRPGASEAEVMEAAKVANAHSFISALPMGYATGVGEKGIQLSGGQKQRIAIARAVLKNPKVLLCDEATSALDNKSERVVQLALERLSKGRTTVVVAHRLSTIIHADQIAVVREGQIVEQGSHKELIAKPGGAYSVLVGLQMSALGAKQADEQEAVEEDELPAKVISKKVLVKDASGELVLKMEEEVERVPWWRRLLSCFNKTPADKKPKAPPVKAGFWRLAKFNKPEWPYFIIGCLGSGVLGAIMPFFALALSTVLGAFYSPDRNYLKHQIRIWCGVFVGIGAAGFAGGVLQGFCFTLMGARLTKRIRVLLMQSLMTQEMAFYDKEENTSGALVARLGTDATSIRGAVGDQAGLLVQNLVTFIAGYAIAFSANWKMTLVITAVLPILIFASFMETQFLTGFSNEASQLYNKANQIASDAFASCRVVAAFNMREVVYQTYCQLMDAPEQKVNKRAQASGWGFAFSQFSMFAIYALGFWYGGGLVADGELSLTDMLRVFFAILLAAMGISQARMAFPDISKASGAVQRVFSIIDRKSNIDATDPKGGRLQVVRGQVELKSVEFAYPERPGIVIFKHFDLVVQPGQTVALCGQSGSGKSSIVALILRFYDPSQGAVLLDGVDIRDLNLTWLRGQMSLVGQEPHLFTGSIRDNIVYGREDATDEEVTEAARAANALDFILSAPAQFNTLVGQNGIQLSGGQRQRIAIARSIIRKPKVLLLDEATSALDAASERVVQEALDRVQTYCTTLVVAHRLSTIRRAHSIAVLQEGKILEQGSHEQLMQRQRGAYRALISQQQQQT